ncbi:aspartic peptidase domain-containing protein [Cadophora sp. MPI-SDFR-AT-0126]|nr:aspartic peptidase domain-containing protein [Leotiomycetes sp. MPI-SDFR-AT-0126]
MISSLVTAAVAVLAVLQLVECESFARDGNTPGIVRLAVVSKTPDASLRKRQFPDRLINDDHGLEYLINFEIGNPPQNVTAALDTGSSDTWVNPQCGTGNTIDSNAICQRYGRYRPEKSPTSRGLKQEMYLRYGSGAVLGEYYVDDLHLNGASIKAQQFGIATRSQGLDTGLMGLSFGNQVGTSYPNIVDQLAAQNITQSRAFSLDLGSIDTPEGSIIFGGIDTKKFYGKLSKHPIIPAEQSPDTYPRYWINMTSLSLTLPPSKTQIGPSATPKVFLNSTIAVFLDSGGTLSMLPASIVRPLAAAFPGAQNVGSGQYTVPCSAMNQTGFVDFGFGEKIIRVPWKEFVWFVEPGLCALGLMEGGEGTNILGDTFLRAAFVVYDQDNHNLHLAESADCGSNLVAIGRGKDAVPSVAGDCNAPAYSDSPGLTTKAPVATPTPAPGFTTSVVKSSVSAVGTPKSTTKTTKKVLSSSAKKSSSVMSANPVRTAEVLV